MAKEKRRFAISDIHGCKKTFEKLLEKINLQKEDELYLLGDFIDRGPESKQVIDLIWSLEADGNKVLCIKGNHDQMMINAKQDSDERWMWTKNGGDTTLKSFGVNHATSIPHRYTNWIYDLPYYLETEGYIFVHAGIDFMAPDPYEAKENMLWIRHWYETINYEWLKGKKIIHGHTPAKLVNIEARLEKLNKTQVLGIDGGCVYKDREGYGHLIAFDLDEQKLHVQSCID